MAFMKNDPYTGRRHAYAAPAAGKGRVYRQNSRNARGSDDDRRQIIADLISHDDSPFLPEDTDALAMMTDASLQATRDAYLKPAKSKSKPKKQDDDEDLPDDSEALEDMVANAVAKALAEHGLATNTTWTKADERRAKVEKDARNLLRGLGIAKPSDDQVRRMVDIILAQLDGENGAERGSAGSADVTSMSQSAVVEELAREADLRGNADKARKLRTMAANQAATDRARGTADALAAPARRLAAARTNVTNADADDADVKAMSEFHGDAAMARSLANKKKAR